MKEFKKIDVKTITDNTFKLIDNEWFLITAGTEAAFNTMTASWGGLGILWNKTVCFTFVRPTRHTYKFTETNDYFTLSFFANEHRKILNFCGAKSGRDTDKINVTGLKPLVTEKGNVYFEQARMVFECKKLYAENIKPENFLLPETEKHYPLKDYHKMYIAEIINCFVE